MYMNVTEFRNNLKKHFDTALIEPVYIERGGITFTLASSLTAKDGTPTGDTPIPKKTKELKPFLEVHAKEASNFEAGDKQFDICKHGAVKGLCKKGCK